MNAAEAALLSLACLGHLVLWVGVYNRVHSLAIPRWTIKAGSVACVAVALMVPLAAYLQATSEPRVPGLAWLGWFWPYVVLCVGLAIYSIGNRIHESLHRFDRAAVLLSDKETSLDMTKLLGRRPTLGAIPTFLSLLPGNEALRVHVHEKEIQAPRLTPRMDRLTLAHISDLHMCGQLDKDFFAEVVRQTNALHADVIAVTGDLFDKNECLAWIGDTLAQLRAPYGVYFILGNHDLRVDSRRARELLCDAGLIDIGGRWRELRIRGERVVLAGNELPWFTPAAEVEQMPPSPRDSGPLRILLAHAPDQIHWARSHDFDIMLAGHTHGGQVRLPLAGPVVAPSWHGTRYTAGTFYMEPTVMHVSRGISGTTQLRYNCPPELTKLVFRSGTVTQEEPASAHLVQAVT